MSTAWLVLAAADLDAYVNEAQSAVLRTSFLSSDKASAFDQAMQDRCNYLRNRIAGRVTLSATAYAIPPELKSQACLLIVEALQSRVRLALTQDQKDQIARAYKDLDIAGTTPFPISDPSDPATEATTPRATSIEQASTPTRVVTRAKLNGL